MKFDASHVTTVKVVNKPHIGSAVLLKLITTMQKINLSIVTIKKVDQPALQIAQTDTF